MKNYPRACNGKLLAGERAQPYQPLLRLRYTAHKADTVKKRSLRKVVDESSTIRSKSGSFGLLKEEVWVDESNQIVKYSLAYIHHALTSLDNGRVLGYDNSHGVHERHRLGRAEVVPFTSYTACLQSFLLEVQEWRSKS